MGSEFIATERTMQEVLICKYPILMIDEIKPMWRASTYYDTFDIIASAVGSIIAIITYELLKK